MKKRKRKLKIKGITYILTIIFTLCILGIGYLGYTLIFKDNHKAIFLETIERNNYANIDYYAIYGIHMNLKGSFTLEEDVNDLALVLKNENEEITIPWALEQDNQNYTFTTSEYINEGIVLENIPIGEYYLLIKTIGTDENNEEVIKYYSLQNQTTYNDLEYYTLTKDNKNNKIDIEWNTYEEIPTLRFTIKETTLPDDVYDITIDPGHGGSDPGKTACSDGSVTNSLGYCNSGNLISESNQNLQVALQLKEDLENLGYKVILTRETDERISIYDPYGSATTANDTKSKLNIAIHHNSSGVGTVKGLEVYIANDTNLDFASLFVDEITTLANTATSTKQLYRVSDGIYQRFFTEEEILEDDVQPSNKTTETIYYYYLREVGGISTHATNDGRYIPTYSKNEHYNSNNTAESYLFELGYMDNYSDLLNIMQNTSGYAEGLATAISKYLAQEE